MYKIDSIAEWHLQQEDLLDIREVLYQEALAKIKDLEHDLKIAKWEVKQADISRELYKKQYENLRIKISKF